MRDHNSLTQVMGASYDALFRDFSALSGHSFERDIRRIRSFPDHAGLLLYLRKHELVLLEFFRTGKIVCNNVKNDGSVPVFLQPLWVDMLSELKSVRVLAASLLRQAMALWKKASLSISPEADFKKFKERQTPVRQTSYVWLKVCDEIASRLGRWFSDLNPDDLLPFVSSGATYAKTPLLDRPEKAERLSVHGYAYKPRGISLVESPSLNRAVAVPKDFSKVRIVFVEQSPRMQVQQSLRLWLESQVESCPLARRISFQNQEFQRRSLRLPRRSSIDLSDASDYVTSSLVWRCLRHLPILRSALFGSRSRMCECDGEVLPLRSYSTMGNATTFTVMSIILATLLDVCEDDFRSYAKTRVRTGTVFGDDIVCDDVIAGTVLDRLRLLGLKPNVHKTFISGPFRESCGLDLFEDIDVTPTSLKRWKSDTPEDIVAQVSYSNALWRKGFWNLANYISNREDVPVNTSSDDTSYVSFSKGHAGRSSVWIADEQRYVWALRARRERYRERDNVCHLDYALLHGRLREKR